MIVREMADGHLLCIHQTSHALMAEGFCRYWGNSDFARPRPHAATLLAIAQHDNGWYEWECDPQLRADGYPMDFIHFSDQVQKTELWRRGIERTWAQHPYAGLLVGNHAALLYRASLADGVYSGEAAAAVEAFLAEQEARRAQAHRLLGQDSLYAAALRPEAVDSNTRLLQFGDRASLQISVPWAADARLSNCPVNGVGQFTALHMRYDEPHITFDPWPYHVDEFEVHMEGYLLAQNRFERTADYQQALAEAPFYRQTWRVQRQG